MKLTKSLLRKIIKEEVDDVLPGTPDEGMDLQNLYSRISKVTSDLVTGNNNLMRSEYTRIAKELIAIKDQMKEMLK
tara:strand:+ start:597 stop:824 length:228 start_codon:yes stop_codon:yes gene_type:complete